MTRWTWWSWAAVRAAATLLQRLARTGGVGGRAGRRALLGSRRRLGQRRGRLPPAVLDRAPRHLRRRSGPLRIQQLRAGSGRVHDPLRRLHPPLPPLGLPYRQRRWGGGRLADQLRGPQALLRSPRAGAPGIGPVTGRGATLTATPTRLNRWAATGRSSSEAPAPSASRPEWGRWPSPTVGSGIGRTASTGGSAFRAARSTPRRHRSSPTSPTPSPMAPRSGPTAW